MSLLVFCIYVKKVYLQFLSDIGFSVEVLATTLEDVLVRSGILLPYRLTELAQLI